LEVENRRLQQEIRLLKTQKMLPPSKSIPVNGGLLRTGFVVPTKKEGAKTILEDDRVLESIEASFRQFHDFLDLLKGSRFSELAHVLGENKPFPEHDKELSPIKEESTDSIVR